MMDSKPKTGMEKESSLSGRKGSAVDVALFSTAPLGKRGVTVSETDLMFCVPSRTST